MTKLISALPRFYAANENLVNTLRVGVELDKPIDGEILRQAVDTSMRRYPYFAVKTAVEDEEYVLLPNDAPVVVSGGGKAVCLGAGEANHHLVAFAYCENIIYLDAFHGLADGAGIFPLLKTVLYYYLCGRERITLDPQGIRLADSEIAPEEFEDPYPASVPESIKPMGAFKPVEQFCLPERTGPHAGERTVFQIRVRESDYMKYTSAHDASPAVLTSVLMYRTVQSLYPDAGLPIVCGMAHNMRKELGKPLAHQSLSPILHLKYSERLTGADMAKLCTCTRGMIMVQGLEENMLVQVRKGLQTIERLKGMSHAEKLQFMQRAAQGLGSDTFKVSYMGRIGWGAMEPYLKKLYSNVDVLNSGVMIEMQACNGYFDFSFLQEFSEDLYVKRFMELLREENIPAEVSDPAPLVIPGLRLEG